MTPICVCCLSLLKCLFGHTLSLSVTFLLSRRLFPVRVGADDVLVLEVKYKERANHRLHRRHTTTRDE